ncbi:hypothetical protein C475_09624 [Halosimplex carlsbadense 2-9-1]|uniref:Uncharacterized protein n=1 Tax=Halosimplex carlsbadense 2-9-1 TaxID=797114 RepID=M0CST1_9EURY|nr:hypothetical protein [Halosimplex carlsbadense]ELZ25708.1 hypothetical protein C475_09624 [Halosimplex carlsbadense 2-9-1]
MSESLADVYGSETDDSSTGIRARLYAAQTNPRDRWALVAVATAVGLALGTVHWVGLLVGGALVGFCWPTLRRALVAGLGFGVVVLLAMAVQFALAGSLDEYLAMGQLLAVSVAVPLVAGPLGAAARGLVPDAPQSRDS